jgi:acetylornithine/succinyldiaminopimelate/putrescine aminotransferase
MDENQDAAAAGAASLATDDKKERLKAAEQKYRKFLHQIDELKETIQSFNEASVRQQDLFGKVRMD